MTTLVEYRNRHAQYKTDPDLQRLHATVPWLVTWHDHEVDNDYANGQWEWLGPHFLRRRTAAYQAYFEHMPLRAPGHVDHLPRPHIRDRRRPTRCAADLALRRGAGAVSRGR